MRKSVSERWGKNLGLLWSPFIGFGTLARRTRLFHARGVVLEGHVEPLARYGPRQLLASRLAGPVLVRFSSAFFEREAPDLLGCALRFRRVPGSNPDPEVGDQDLLLATARHPASVLVDLVATRPRDYLANVYYGVSPFEASPLGRVRFRLVPTRDGLPAETREQRLLAALRDRPLELVLEVKPDMRGTGYEPLARVVLLGRATVDERVLAFDPFRAGRGIEPVGFVHGLRFATYALAARMRGSLEIGNGHARRRVLRWNGHARARPSG